MKLPFGIIWCMIGGLLLPLLTVTGIQVREPENDGVVSSGSPPLTATEPTDNGMTVGEAPLEATTAASISTPLFAVSPETDFASVKPTVDAVFPENHKNFTSSPYLGAIETPPLLSNFNKYQNAYKEYYHQKNEFIKAKPVKFEENHARNRYVTNGLSAYGEETQAGSDVHVQNRPFPYIYEANTGLGLPETSTTEDENNIQANHDGLNEQDSTNGQTGLNAFSQGEGSILGGLFGRGSQLQTEHFQHDHHNHELKTDHHHHHHDHQDLKVKKPGSWKKVVRFLSTVIPFGLFLATLAPSFLQISTVEDTRPSRLRSLDESQPTSDSEVEPLMRLVQSFGGLESMDDPVCEDRFFCEMSVLGKEESGNFVEKGFWFLANETPEEMAEAAGMKELFKAIKTSNCGVYDCKRKDNPKESRELVDAKPVEPKKKDVKPRKMKKFYRS